MGSGKYAENYDPDIMQNGFRTGKPAIFDDTVTINGLLSGNISARTAILTLGIANTDRVLTSTSDYATFNAAVSDLSTAGGGQLYVRGPLSFAPTDHLRLKSNVTVVFDSSVNVTLAAGKGLIALGVSKCRVQGLNVDASAHSTTDKAVQIGDSSGVTSSDITFSDCSFLNCSGFGIFTSASGTNVNQRVIVDRCRITGRGGNDLIGGGPLNSTGAGVRDIIVTNSFIEQDATQGVNYTNAFDIVGAYRLKFVNNIVAGGMIFGSEQWPHRQSIISGNTIRNPGTGYVSQVGFIIDASANQESHYINITNNTLENSYIRLTSNASGQCKNVVCIGNNVDATGCTNGIVAKNVDGLAISGIVSNATSDGISLSGVTNGRYDVLVRDCGGVGFNVDNTCSTNNFSNSSVINCFGVGNFNGFNNSLFNVVGANPVRKSAATVSTTRTVDLTDGDYQVFTLSANTSFTFNNAKIAGMRMTVVFITGGFTVTLPSNVKVAGGSFTATGTSLLRLVWDTNWLEEGRAIAVA